MRVATCTTVWATLVLISACGAGPQPPAPAVEPAPETAPKVVAAEPGALIGPIFVAEMLEGQPVTEGVESSIRFDAEGRATGRAGCNNFQGSYEVDGTSVSFGPMAVTRMMCPPAVMDQESAFLQAIDRATSFAWDDDGALLLMAEDGEPSRFLPVSSGDESEG